MTVSFLDLGAAYRELRDEIDQAVSRVLASGWYIGGEEVAAFESAFAAYCGSKHCVGVGNGLDALQLALRALGIGPGDEVIVAANTFIATLLAVTAVGATPVPVEPNPATFNLDVAGVQAALTGRTRAIMPTHLYGQPSDLEPLLAVARRAGVFVIEDAAQAHGARYRDTRIGAHGDLVAWSFYPGKNLGALGDGGAVTTNDAALAERVRMLGNYGAREKYVHEVKGANSRLDPVQAAVLGVKLRHLDEWNARRERVASTYLEGLAGTCVVLPRVPQWSAPSWHLFVVRSKTRSQLHDHLAARGIHTLVHYPIPPHLQEAYKDLGFGPGAFPITETLADEVLSLPMGPHLGKNDVTRVIDAIRDVA